jgi:hypothetical protein
VAGPLDAPIALAQAKAAIVAVLHGVGLGSPQSLVDHVSGHIDFSLVQKTH